MSKPITSPEQQEATPAAGGEHTFTQAEVDAIVSREKAKAAAKALKESSNEDYKAQYEAVKKELEDMKAEQSRTAKVAAVRAYYQDNGITGKSLEIAMKGSAAEIDALELDGDGKIKDYSSIDALIGNVFSGLVVHTVIRGADVPHPPVNYGGGGDRIADAFKPKI